ncbi:hypothetical protein Bca4012_068250 [Brassica carinata]
MAETQISLKAKGPKRKPSTDRLGYAYVEEAGEKHVWRSSPSVRHASLRLDPTVSASPSRHTLSPKPSFRRSS